MCGFFWYVAYKKYHATCMVFFGAPGTTRTYDPQIRNLMLYPTELRAQFGGTLQFADFRLAAAKTFSTYHEVRLKSFSCCAPKLD